MSASAYSAALTAIEMSLKRHGAAWTRGPEDATGVVICGVDSGRPFAFAIHGLLGVPSADLKRFLFGWRKAGAATGTAHTVAEALSIVTAGSSSRAS